MKKENKGVKIIKIITIALLVVLISMIGFFGIYKQNQNRVEDITKGYSYAMDIKGSRNIELVTKEDGQENLTEENFKKSKKIIEDRLKELNITNYILRLNETKGNISIELEENTNTDDIISSIYSQGKFEIIDEQTQEVLMNNNDIKSSQVLYSSTSSGTSVYLEIAFNKDGKEKIKNISETYVKSGEQTEEAQNQTTEENVTSEENTENESKDKKIIMKIDDKEIMTTSFDEPITTGKIQLSVGTATTNTDTLQDYMKQAQAVAISLDKGKLPIKYEMEHNEFIYSNITEQNLKIAKIIIASIILIGIILLIFRYKINGLLSGISFIGLIALYLLLIRYANVLISIEGILGIIVVLVLNYIFNIMLLKHITQQSNINKATKETYKKFILRIIPICIISIAFCFIKWIPLSSFGMTMFWGLVLSLVYNLIITRTLLKIEQEEVL